MYKFLITVLLASIGSTWGRTLHIAPIHNQLWTRGANHDPYILFRDAIVHEDGVLVTMPCLNCPVVIRHDEEVDDVGSWDELPTVRSELVRNNRILRASGRANFSFKLLDLTISEDGQSILLNGKTLYRHGPLMSLTRHHKRQDTSSRRDIQAVQTNSNTTRKELVTLIQEKKITPRKDESWRFTTWDLDFTTGPRQAETCHLASQTAKCIRLDIRRLTFQGHTVILQAENQPVLYIGVENGSEGTIVISTIAVQTDHHRSGWGLKQNKSLLDSEVTSFTDKARSEFEKLRRIPIWVLLCCMAPSMISGFLYFLIPHLKFGKSISGVEADGEKLAPEVNDQVSMWKLSKMEQGIIMGS